MLTKEGAKALSQCCVLMKGPSECLKDSAYLGPEGCSVRKEGFGPCLYFELDVREYNLELSDSRPNLFLSSVSSVSVSFSRSRQGVFQLRFSDHR